MIHISLLAASIQCCCFQRVWLLVYCFLKQAANMHLISSHAALSTGVHLPVQYGGAPLHVPSSWQRRVAFPTSTPPGRQECCMTEPYVQLWVPDTTALGGAPGSPQEIATETVTNWEAERKGYCEIGSSSRFQPVLLRESATPGRLQPGRGCD